MGRTAMLRRNLDKETAPLRSKAPITPKAGWIRSIREALGMSQAELAKRAGVNQSTIHSLESTEVNQKIQLDSLEKVADLLNCDFVYAFVPRNGLEEDYTTQATKIADAHIKRVYNNMALEKQSVRFSRNKIAEIINDIKDREAVKWQKMANFPGHHFDGKTLIDDDERFGLLLDIKTRGELNIAEAQSIEKANRDYLALKRAPKVEQLLTTKYAKRLHKDCFGAVWDWAGQFRQVATMPGIDWHQIPTSLKQLLDNTVYRIENIYSNESIDRKKELVSEFAYRLVVIHPFRNGNGRWSRIYADRLADTLGVPLLTWGVSIDDEDERHRQMLNALILADTTDNLSQFTEWAMK